MGEPTISDISGYWSRVQKSDGCWAWTGATGKLGRGQIQFKGRRINAPRIAWMMEHGDMPPGEMYVCHTCDNPNCVNPKHLFLGTHTDNMRDKVAKGRHYEQKKTHCPHGHPYSKENTYRYRGQRVCRTCDRGRDRKRKPKALDAANKGSEVEK